jgi:predicted nucleic acid-binding protein
LTEYLLDASALIALVDKSHVHFERVRRWAGRIDRFAVCPVVEGALVRYLIRIGQDRRSVRRVLEVLSGHPARSFWPDAVSYLDVDLGAITCHRQVTDAYLIAQVRAHPGSILATLDQPLAMSHPAEAILVP